MAGCQGHHHGLAQHGLDADVRLLRHQAVKAHADAPLAQRLQLRVFGQVVQHDLHLGARLVKARQDARNHVQHTRAEQPHIQTANQTLARQPGALQRLLRQGEQVGGFLQQGAARVGERHALGGAHKQRHANFFFQGLDVARQRRLRQMQARGGTAYMAFFGHGEKVAHITQIHENSGGCTRNTETVLNTAKNSIGRYQEIASSSQASPAC